MRARTDLTLSPSSWRFRDNSWLGKNFSLICKTPPLRLTRRDCAKIRRTIPEVSIQEASSGMRKATRSLWRSTSVRVVVMWEARHRLNVSLASDLNRIGELEGGFVVHSNIVQEAFLRQCYLAYRCGRGACTCGQAITFSAKSVYRAGAKDGFSWTIESQRTKTKPTAGRTSD